MKTRIITTVAVAGLLTALASGEGFAAGNGGGRGQGTGGGSKQMSQIQNQSQMQTQTRARVHTQATSETTSANRPVDSQRRDGTFLTTGSTANGSTNRPDTGQGLQDGSR